jgi:hypothetical protein
MADNEDLLDYEDEEQTETAIGDVQDSTAKKEVKGTYVSIHSSGFRDFLLKPEILRAIADCGFEHPSEGMYVRMCVRSCGVTFYDNSVAHSNDIITD